MPGQCSMGKRRFETFRNGKVLLGLVQLESSFFLRFFFHTEQPIYFNNFFQGRFSGRQESRTLYALVPLPHSVSSSKVVSVFISTHTLALKRPAV